MSAPWNDLSRWHCQPVRAAERTVGWRVVSAAGTLADEPHTFAGREDGYRRAQRRADDLNRAEQYAMIGAKVPA